MEVLRGMQGPGSEGSNPRGHEWQPFIPSDGPGRTKREGPHIMVLCEVRSTILSSDALSVISLPSHHPIRSHY
jgi:hypothetical protein